MAQGRQPIAKLGPGALQKLTLSNKAGGKFVAQLNPSKLSFARQFKVESKNAANMSHVESGTNKPEPDEISFELLLDATGVVPTDKDVQGQIKALMEVVSAESNEKIEVLPVTLQWGGLDTIVTLQSINVEYKMFDASGAPLRALVNLSFRATKTTLVAKARPSASANKVVTVLEGQTLASLAARQYGSSSSGVMKQLAQHNGLSSFDVKVGTKLSLPPLKASLGKR